MYSKKTVCTYIVFFVLIVKRLFLEVEKSYFQADLIWPDRSVLSTEKIILI
jgi:hypothetical protein